MKKNQNKTKERFDVTIHHSIKGRKRFKLQMWIRLLILLVFLCGCSVMVMFGGWTWDTEKGLMPVTNPTQGWHYALIWLGAIFALAAIIGYTVWTIKTIKKFYETQAQYFKTKEFEEAKKKALSVNISKLDKKTIKWYKKMGYLTGSQKAEYLDRLATYKKEQKNKNKHA